MTTRTARSLSLARMVVAMILGAAAVRTPGQRVKDPKGTLDGLSFSKPKL